MAHAHFHIKALCVGKAAGHAGGSEPGKSGRAAGLTAWSFSTVCLVTRADHAGPDAAAAMLPYTAARGGDKPHDNSRCTYPAAAKSLTGAQVLLLALCAPLHVSARASRAARPALHIQHQVLPHVHAWHPGCRPCAPPSPRPCVRAAPRPGESCTTDPEPWQQLLPATAVPLKFPLLPTRSLSNSGALTSL